MGGGGGVTGEGGAVITSAPKMKYYLTPYFLRRTKQGFPGDEQGGLRADTSATAHCEIAL